MNNLLINIEEQLKSKQFEKHNDFELFKSSVCHYLRKEGDLNFIISVLETNIIEKLYNKKWYPECFYFLAMLDYISKENDISICENYNYIREYKLEEMLYPFSISLLCKLQNNNNPKKYSLKKAIPEFLEYNIVESEIRNVF